MRNPRFQPLIPTLPAAAEQNLQKGETASSFVAQAIRESMDRRKHWSEFAARGLASREEAKCTGIYIAADAVVGRLERMLAQAKSDQ